jgi:hypothetical protein
MTTAPAAVTGRKDDAPPAVQAVIVNVAGVDSISVDGGLIQTTSGFALITCPDLRSVCALVAADALTAPAYVSPAGPITPHDILFGHRASKEMGNLHMAHRCGFTETVLVASLQAAGFQQVASLTRPKAFDLWALATCTPWPEQALRNAAARPLPATG